MKLTHRARGAFASLLMAFMLLLPATATPVSAVTLTTSLAGRPIHADTVDWCTGIAYGRVNNQRVLFTAHHCNNNGTIHQGDTIYASTGQVLGTWGSSAGAAHDLGYIVLAQGAWPVSPYVIYRGACDTGCYGGTSDYWTVDNYNGDSAYSCANLPARVNALANQNWRTTQSSTSNYVTGIITNIVNGCSMQTSISSHCNPGGTQYKDSGSGMVKTSGEVIGIASLSTQVCGGKIIFTSFYEGMLDIQFVYNNSFLCTLSGGTGCT